MANLTITVEAAPFITGQWFGETGKTNAIARTNPSAVVSVIGPPGKDATRSTDAGNQLTTGTDGGLFMGHPQLSTAQW